MRAKQQVTTHVDSQGIRWAGTPGQRSTCINGRRYCVKHYSQDSVFVTETPITDEHSQYNEPHTWTWGTWAECGETPEELREEAMNWGFWAVHARLATLKKRQEAVL